MLIITTIKNLKSWNSKSWLVIPNVQFLLIKKFKNKAIIIPTVFEKYLFNLKNSFKNAVMAKLIPTPKSPATENLRSMFIKSNILIILKPFNKFN